MNSLSLIRVGASGLLLSLMSGLAHANAAPGALAPGAVDAGFLTNVKTLFCSITTRSGPLVSLVSGAALVVFAVLFIMDEGKGYMSSALRIMIGIALLVFIPNILSSAFGINLGCQ